MESQKPIEKQGNNLKLRVFLQPKASRDEIVGLHNDELKIAITAPPSEGQANAHLIKFLSKTFKVAKSAVILKKGELNRHKQLLILDPKQLPSKIKDFIK
ncbi:DUF167 family protein YggU [Seminibacterium arietis]|uniref:UPF0235 protein ACFQ02_06945 n=1 Tax=Seminibacterium arietis TaxID=1173502 RepID=A0ABW3I9U7_9PAST